VWLTCCSSWRPQSGTASWLPPIPGGTPGGRGLVILGVLGAPALLGLLRLAVPALLAAFGLLPGH
jgi:hypothetical protein